MRLLILTMMPTLASAQSTGSDRCPCLTDLSAYGIRSDSTQTAVIAEQRYTYPAGYGLGCGSHDARLAPYCDVFGFPSWCADSWCYVDPANCNLVASQGTYFSSDLFFSYRTCGDTNTYNNWFGGSGPGGTGTAGGEQHQLVELVNLTSRYLESVVNALEETESELHKADLRSGGGCPYTTSCTCCGCREDAAWSSPSSPPNSITLRATTTTPYPDPRASPQNIDACLSEVIESQFQRIAATEADATRVGYEYYGSQLGTYMQWPGVQFCPAVGSYDPRFRPWFSGGVSGPKDMVIVIDTSGSMFGRRIQLAEEAATRVIDTLTENDFAAIVAFDNTAVASSSTLTRMTDANKANARSWIAQYIKASGGTSFEAAFARVWSLMAASTTPGVTTSSCNKLVLFMSDGVPSTWTEAHYADTRAQATAYGAHVLTYALGSQADSTVLQRISCEASGVFYPVSDDANLGDVMASYYTVVSPLLQPCQVRFTEYEDVFTKRRLLSACLAAYKKTDRTAPTTCALKSQEYASGAAGALDDSDAVPHLIGVACMDMSLIASRAQLEAHPGYAEFRATVDAQKAMCPRRVLTESALEQLRAAVSPLSVCGTAAASSAGPPATSASYSTRDSPVKQACAAPSPSPPRGEEEEENGSGIAGSLFGFAFIVAGVLGVVAFVKNCRQRQRRAGEARAAQLNRNQMQMSTPAQRAQPPMGEPVAPMGQPVAYAQPYGFGAAQPVPVVMAQPIQGHAMPVAVAQPYCGNHA